MSNSKVSKLQRQNTGVHREMNVGIISEMDVVLKIMEAKQVMQEAATQIMKENKQTMGERK